MINHARITGTAKYVPEQKITNKELSDIMDTNDEWIYSRTGIRQRHIVTDEDTSDLCSQVAQQLITNSNYSPLDIDFIIVATMTPDYVTPSVACLVQAQIGATNAFAMDVSAACSGFIYALATAEKFIKSGVYQKGIVIGGETMSKIIDWSDRSTAVLFGDGAAGVMLEASSTQQFLGESLKADGHRSMSLTAGQLANQGAFANDTKTVQKYLTMDGRDIFDFALRNVSKNIVDIVVNNGLTLEKVDFVLAHQANTRILDGIAKKTKIPGEKFLMNIANYGNTSAASVALLLHDTVESGQLILGSTQHIVLTGFGGGLTWGSILLSL
ncbi:beta-ketoacyl-ACP synthase III [Vagococcus salmoninarum]|uniref:beta-ketoacyl-ACP synthase III n=1 Tax=Vagococcus salmoninarum TaxID=2739 RepID=UPI003F9AB239